jgi:hypothetical protein
MESIEFEVINWEKFNPRKDIKHPTWFAMSNRILEDPKFFGFSGEQFKAVIYLFSQASQKGSAKAVVFLDHAEQVCKIEPNCMLATIEALVARKVIVCALPKTKARTQPSRKRTRTSRDTTDRQTDTTLQDTTVNASEPRSPVSVDRDLNAEIWKAYADAYFDRYKTEPVRNAKVNGQVAQLAKRLGSEAPDVVRFYLSHPKTFYIGKMHEFGLCLSDAESLRTQWAKGRAITNTDLKRFEKNQESRDLDRLIDEGKI